MNYPAFAFLALLSVVLVFTACKLTIAIFGNFNTGLRIRNTFIARAKLLRFGRILEKMGIDIKQYLHFQPVTVIDNQLRACENCLSTDLCDAGLKRPNITAANLGFCPNLEELTNFKLLSRESTLSQPQNSKIAT